jgi:hypothetical protein
MKSKELSNLELIKMIKSGGVGSILESDFSYAQVKDKVLSLKLKALEDIAESIKIYLGV